MTPPVTKVYPIEDIPRTLSDTLIQGTSSHYHQQKCSDKESTHSNVRRWSDTNLTSTSSVTKSLMVTTISMKEKWKSMQCNVFINSMSVVFITDMASEDQEFWEVASLICDNVVFNAVQSEVIHFNNMLIGNVPYVLYVVDYEV